MNHAQAHQFINNGYSECYVLHGTLVAPQPLSNTITCQARLTVLLLLLLPLLCCR
jgi:hypothetical protein